jgi:hypothetical protein
MLHELSEGLQYSYHTWLILCANGEYYDQHPDDRVLEILDNRPKAYFDTAQIERCLAREAENCQACRTIHIQSAQVGDGHWARGEDEEEDDGEELEPEDSQDECIQGGDMLENDEHAPHTQNVNGLPKEYPDGIPTSLRKLHKALERARCRPFMKPRTPKPTIQMIELQPRRFEILRRNKKQDFDDYFNGPSLEDMRMFQSPGGLESQPLDWFSKPTICSP